MEAYHLCAMPSVLWSYHARVPSSRHPPVSMMKDQMLNSCRTLLNLCFQGRGRGEGRGARGGGGKPRGERLRLLKIGHFKWALGLFKWAIEMV